MSIGAVSNTSAGEDDSLFVGGLAHTHFQQRVVNTKYLNNLTNAITMSY